MGFALGDKVAIIGTVIHLYHPDREPEWQSAQVQLADGQGVMTNLRNLQAAPDPVGSGDEETVTLPPDLQRLLDEALAQDAPPTPAPEGDTEPTDLPPGSPESGPKGLEEETPPPEDPIAPAPAQDTEKTPPGTPRPSRPSKPAGAKATRTPIA